MNIVQVIASQEPIAPCIVTVIGGATSISMLPEVNIGRHCRITKAMVEKGFKVPEVIVISENKDDDKKRFHMSPGGIVLVTSKILGHSRHMIR